MINTVGPVTSRELAWFAVLAEKRDCQPQGDVAIRELRQSGHQLQQDYEGWGGLTENAWEVVARHKKKYTLFFLNFIHIKTFFQFKLN